MRVVEKEMVAVEIEEEGMNNKLLGMESQIVIR